MFRGWLRRRREARRYEKVDPWEFTQRAEAMNVRHNQLTADAHRLGDEATAALREDNLPLAREKMAGMDDLKVESELILRNIRDLRLEQLDCQRNGWRRLRPDAIEVPR